MKRIVVSVAFAGLLAVPMVYAATGKKTAHAKTNAASSTKPASPPISGDWKPAPNLVSSLGRDVAFGEYAMRVPEGYNEVQMPPALVAQLESQGSENHVFGTIRRSNTTHGVLAITLVTQPTTTTGTPALDDSLQIALAHNKQRWQDFVESKPENGKISGLAFERAYFKGTYVDGSVTRLAHGLVYVTDDQSKIMTFVAQDSEPYSGQTLPVAEAAILTFHKQ